MTTILPTEKLSNLGYGALKVQADGNTPITPDTYFYLYKETLFTDLKLDLDNPIAGNRMKLAQAYMGKRAHDGVLTVLAEPNTAQYWFDMMLKKGSITGGGPYTHPFTLDDPQNYYTIDLLKGELVERFFGVQAESISPTWDKNKMQFDIDVTAKGSFIARSIASTSTSPNHIILDTLYDPAPTTGLVNGDVIRVYKSDASAILDLTITTVIDGVTLLVSADPTSMTTGDIVFLRAATSDIEVNNLDPFLWTRTQFQFSDTAANALTAAQTNIEVGTKWKLMYAFAHKQGDERSGSFDPVSLPRLQGEAQVTAKVFFDQPFDKMRYLNVQDRACVIRHFSGADKELRITLDGLKQKTSKEPLETGKLIYSEIEYEARWIEANEEGFAVTVINGNSA